MKNGSVLKSVTLQDILGETISREEAMSLIKSNTETYNIFLDFSERHQEDVLEFIQGNKGLPILYDGFYKYVLDPERHPERLESFLSNLFAQEVKIEQVLSREGNKLVEDGSLVVMDIIVKLSDGSIVDVEMQKCGYMFTGERSTKEFKKVYPAFIHRLKNQFDSEVSLKLLSNLTYISLDTFHEVSQNIDNQMEAWLTFLSSDKPEDMIRLVEKYPEFKECYHDIRMFRQKPEELISMFSEALIQMDKNTVQYMIEEQQKELEEQQKELEEQRKKILEQNNELKSREKEIAVLKEENIAKDTLIASLEEKLSKQTEE